jgi:ribosomal protein S12 methylthiotransferase accessory factor
MQGNEVWIPASCAFVPYLFESGVEPFTHMPISTGLAAGSSLESCIDKGVCEIIERDALMIIWYARIPVPRIDPMSCYGISAEIDGLLGSIRTAGTSWLLNCLTLDVDIPVVSAALIDEGSPPLTSFGIAANMDPTRALQNALEEAVMTRLLVNRCGELRDYPMNENHEFRTLRDHLLGHAGSSQLRTRMKFLTSDGPLVDFSNVGWSFDSTTTSVQKCRAAGLEPIWTEITTPDVSEFGFKVVRTVIAGMQPLDNDHRYRHLGGARLLSVPRKLGYGLRSIEELNPDPHPFP